MPELRTRHEHLAEATTLSAVGGFLDACTFLACGGVFANAQTGNVVLLGVELADAHWVAALRHVPPILAFLVGVLCVEALARRRHQRLRRPVRLILLTEMVCLTAVGLAPATVPTIVLTIVITWATTLQMTTFRQVRGSAYSPTFTTANLKNLASECLAWIADRDRTAAPRAQALLAVTSAFLAGALLGGSAVRLLHLHAVLLTVPALAAVCFRIIRTTQQIEAAQDHV